MRYNKYSAIASLICTGVPFVSALLSNYIPLPFAQEDSFKIIMTVMFVLAWLFLAHIVSEMPDEFLQKIHLIKLAHRQIIGYWIIDYTDDHSYSLLQIRDDCEVPTKSFLQDFDRDLSMQLKKGIHHIDFNGDNQLSYALAKVEDKFSYIRFDFRVDGVFDIARLDDNGTSAPVKRVGLCERVTPRDLDRAGICEDKKIAKNMLSMFQLSDTSIRTLLEYRKKNKDSVSGKDPDISSKSVSVKAESADETGTYKKRPFKMQKEKSGIN